MVSIKKRTQLFKSSTMPYDSIFKYLVLERKSNDFISRAFRLIEFIAKESTLHLFLFIQCGRFTLDGLVSESEVHKLLDVAKKGLAKGGGSGGASILGNLANYIMDEGS